MPLSPPMHLLVSTRMGEVTIGLGGRGKPPPPENLRLQENFQISPLSLNLNQNYVRYNVLFVFYSVSKQFAIRKFATDEEQPMPLPQSAVNLDSRRKLKFSLIVFKIYENFLKLSI